MCLSTRSGPVSPHRPFSLSLSLLFFFPLCLSSPSVRASAAISRDLILYSSLRESRVNLSAANSGNWRPTRPKAKKKSVKERNGGTRRTNRVCMCVCVCVCVCSTRSCTYVAERSRATSRSEPITPRVRLEKESDDRSVEPRRGRRKKGRGVGVRKKAPRLKRKGGRPRDSRAEPNVSPHCRAHCRL